MLSGGVASWAAGKEVVRRGGTRDLVCLFTDTNYEDEDTYRFLEEAAEDIAPGSLVRINTGLDQFLCAFLRADVSGHQICIWMTLLDFLHCVDDTR